MAEGYGFAIDRGGTFTDVYARRPDGSSTVMKLLSEDPRNYKDAPTEAIRRILEQELGLKLPKEKPVPTEKIAWIRMGTTVATNALLERNGEPTALVVNKGFGDLLHIGNQTRPKIFDLRIECPSVLYTEVVEVEERVILKQDRCEMNVQKRELSATTGDKLYLCTPLNENKLRESLEETYKKGIRSLAVVLLHSYMFPNHELRIGEIAKKIGFTNISLSSQIMPMIKAVSRGFTACADAYLTPKIDEYVQNFSSGFENKLQGVQVLFMQSDGGLSPVNTFNGSRAVLSGPAGGVVGMSRTSYNRDKKTPVIGFDMGGTSTDVTRYAGQLEHIFESMTAGVAIQAPQLDIHTVAAGGGSRLFFRTGLFQVGPESSRADPGPVCYRKGGHLAVTDVNLVLGRIIPEFFPKIFGKTEKEALDYKAAKNALKQLTQEINEYNVGGMQLTVEEAALGFVKVANEAMCRPIRAITQSKGHDTSKHMLACFGGAGGQHACSIARALGMRTVHVHKYAGILSAYGLAMADVVYEAQQASHKEYKKENFGQFDDRLQVLRDECRAKLKGQGFSDANISLQSYMHMRYDRTQYAVMCQPTKAVSSPKKIKLDHPKSGDFKTTFSQEYLREFGFVIEDRAIIVEDLRVRGVGSSGICENIHIEKAKEPSNPPVTTKTKCYFEGGYKDTNVYLLDQLNGGHRITGPAIIIDKNNTILIEPDCVANIENDGSVMIQVGRGGTDGAIGTDLDPIQLSIFSHRFMSIAEQMGKTLQRTAISTNIKERLDFSCALFGPDGGLIANAPHIPVHLGAMQETVRYQYKTLGAKGMANGDVILCNHPCNGGSHLPDLTVITPVYYRKTKDPVFFVANRGHHADIGGLVPGSMPPNAITLKQEGAIFCSFKLVDKGVFQEDKLIEALKAPAKVEGCSGARNIPDNVADLRAQVASNQKGIQLVCELIDIYSLDVVQAYMTHIQLNAEIAFAKSISKTECVEVSASDFMDDGSEIKLAVKIDSKTGDATFDFSGTGPEMYTSCNAPKAVTLSAIIYSMRCLVDREIPLNQGCLTPIHTIVPQGSILNPSPECSVVAGNTLVSQRITDVILKCFNACAASQGCMNNITFGDASVGYYETVAGGAGAGPGWNGRSGVHTHMTNTRITDPEIMERRYPVIINRFGLRAGSGGVGQYRGGDGVVREYLFRRPLTLSILTERRVFAPFGLNGGGDGKRGRNLLAITRDGATRTVNLGSKNSSQILAGDVLYLKTPGGGAWGKLCDG